MQSVTTSAKQRAVRGTRRGAPVEWSERDGRLLRIVGEQYAITVQQLAGLLGRTQRNGRWLRDRWLRAGWIESHPFGWHGPSFLWLTGKGIRVCDSPYRRWRPNTAMLAVNDSMKPENTHENVDSPPSWATIVGIAVVTNVVSVAARKRLSMSAPVMR